MNDPNYFGGLAAAIILPILGLIGVCVSILMYRGLKRGRGTTSMGVRLALIFGIAIISIPTLCVGGFYARMMALAPTPSQSAAKVAEVLNAKPNEIVSVEISPYAHPGVGVFPFGAVSFTRPDDVFQICDALHSAQPARVGDFSFPFHPNSIWTSHFIIRTKTTIHHCYATKLASNTTLIDIFYDMAKNERAYLGTFQTTRLATVLEALAEQ